MVETDKEVESVLREIRERVRSENKAAIVPVSHNDEANVTGANGDATAHGEGIAPSNELLREANNALLRMKMNLATTERAWSRLPPLFSYRYGFPARAELWLKRQIKRATHWFTWEQINFNSAVHQSLSELHTALVAHEQTLVALQQQTDGLHTTTVQLIALQNEMQNLRAGIETRFVEIENTLAADVAQMRQTLVSNIEHLREDARKLADTADAQNAAMLASVRREWQEQLQSLQKQSLAQTGDLQHELHERIQHILDEQRACHKQLALQTSESAVVADRARRNFESRIMKLESHIENKQ